MQLSERTCGVPDVAPGAEQTYTTATDYASMVDTAPGRPQGSVFSGFEGYEDVSLVNGNLLITHPASPSYPLDGGASIGIGWGV